MAKKYSQREFRYHLITASHFFQMTLANSTNVNVREKDGFTPLMLAALLGDEPTVLALLSAGADVHLESNASSNALKFVKISKVTGGTYSPAIVFALKVATMKE